MDSKEKPANNQAKEVERFRTRIIGIFRDVLGQAATTPWICSPLDPQFEFRFGKLYNEQEEQIGWIYEEHNYFSVGTAESAHNYHSYIVCNDGDDRYFGTKAAEIFTKKPSGIAPYDYHRNKLKNKEAGSPLELSDYEGLVKSVHIRQRAATIIMVEKRKSQ